MARWRVTAKHYINARQFGEPTTWVREETNRDTGRAFRRTFSVPLYIDPEDPICINKNLGICVVATEGSEMPGDIIIDGPPTPDMEPLDDAARDITAKESVKWKDPINSLPIEIGEDFGQRLLAMFTSQLNTAGSPNASLKSVPDPQIAELKSLLAEQQKQIAQLMAGAGGPPPSTNDEVDINADLPPAPPPVATKPNLGRRA